MRGWSRLSSQGIPVSLSPVVCVLELRTSDWPPGPKARVGPQTTTWPARTSPLICGERDAVLVDALLTVDEGERLAIVGARLRKRLRAIFVTQGHPDDLLRRRPVLGRLPLRPVDCTLRQMPADFLVVGSRRDQ